MLRLFALSLLLAIAVPVSGADDDRRWLGAVSRVPCAGCRPRSEWPKSRILCGTKEFKPKLVDW